MEHPPEKPPNPQPDAPARVDEFVRLLARNQRRIFVYVATLMPNPGEADEVLQETNLVLWREFDRFAPGTNFAAWACKVAMYQVLAWRKKRQRDRHDFGDEFLEAVAEEAATSADVLEERSRALAGCVERLPTHQRELVNSRYGEGLDVDAIARKSGRTTEAVYRALSRIRGVLHDCVTRSLAQENGT